MKKILSTLFSDQYANRTAIGNNFLLLLMYRFAYPFAVILSRIGLSANTITTMSVILSVMASFSLIQDDEPWMFIIFWGCALLFDFCDGTVARKTKTTRKTAFRYDHTSDLCKIFIVILAVGIEYQHLYVWILSISALFMFLFYVVLNHDLNIVRQKNKEVESKVISKDSNNNSYATLAEGGKFDLIKASYAAFLSINGHTLLVFFLFPFGINWALIGLTYLATLSLFRSLICIHFLKTYPK